MIDLFGRKRRQELFDRAYAEFISGNYGITEKNLTQLINEGNRNFYVFNLRAQTYLALNKLHLAFKDSITSTQIEANIEKNKDAYDIRNFITSQLKSGELKVDIYELSYFFEIENVFQLFEEHCCATINLLKNNNPEFKLLIFDENKIFKLLFIAFNYLFFNLVQIIQNSKTDNWDKEFVLNFKKALKNSIKKHHEKRLKPVGENLKYPFYWLPAELHFSPYFERTISFSLEEHILPAERWLFWLGEDHMKTLTNYVFKSGHEPNRIALNEEVHFLESFILDIKENIIEKPMII